MDVFTRSPQEVLAIYDRQVDTVYRVCFAFMRNAPEAEDMTQETFLRLMTWGKPFQNRQHERAWLIVTASNLCRDALGRAWRREENLDDYEYLAATDQQLYNPVLEAVLALPEDYKTAVYMYYYEGYSTVEIAQYLNCPEATVRSRLSRARGKLKEQLGGVAK